MHFRNGNIAYAYMGNLILLLQEAGKLNLTDQVSRYLPDITWPAGSEAITLEYLVKCSSGIRDYVPNPNFQAQFYSNTFQFFTPQQLIDIAFAAGPLLYDPGTAFSYAHTNFMLLGLALARAGGQSLDKLLNKYVIKPLHLPNTAPALTTDEPGPVLHTYTHERDVFEETTFWNPSWFSAPGSVVTTNICDVSTSAVGIGKGCLLSRRSYEKFVEFTNYTMPPDCPEGVCRVFNKDSTAYFGVGVLINHGWIFQTPKFGGTGQIHAYLPSAKLSVAIIYTNGPFTNDSIVHSTVMWTEIARQLTPGNIPF
jgi:CubicO group peptidase (beta-lactamase class C family)